jgi:hypothetical protein
MSESILEGSVDSAASPEDQSIHHRRTGAVELAAGVRERGAEAGSV